MPHGLGAITLRQMDADYQAVATLAQRFNQGGGKRYLHCGPSAALYHEFSGRSLQCVQPQLARTLSFYQDPVIVPAGQQLISCQFTAEIRQHC
jgi:hypothetical protein